MNARIVRDWRGVLELIYRCQKCKGTLSSSRMELEAGKDSCPDCGTVVHFPPSVVSKFQAAEHQHQETLAEKKNAKAEQKQAKAEQKQAKAEQKKAEAEQKEAELWRKARLRGDYSYCPPRLRQFKQICFSMCILSVPLVILFNWLHKPRYGAPEARPAQIQQDEIRTALNKNYNAQGTGAFGTYEHERVAGGYVTEIRGENAFGGTVSNLIYTTDQGEQINLSAP